MNKEPEPFKVVNYALSLNKYWWTIPEAANVILYYAIGREASKLDVSLYDACRQIAYLFARHRDYLPANILEFLEQTDLGEGIVEIIDYDFDQDTVADEMTTIVSGNPDFADLCREWYQFYLSYRGQSKFSLDYNCDRFGQFQGYLQYFPISNDVPTSLPLLMLLEWENKDSVNDVALIAMYSAIRSIIGRKQIAATTRAFIHSRMFGARNGAELAQMTKSDKNLKKSAEAWNPTKHRRKFKGLLDELRKRRLINYFGDRLHRRIYVSLTDDDEAFARQVKALLSPKPRRPDIGLLIENVHLK